VLQEERIGAVRDAARASRRALSVDFPLELALPRLPDAPPTPVISCAAVTAEAVPLLRNVSGNGPRLHELTGRLVDLEGDADDLHAVGLKKAFQEIAPTSPVNFAIAREVFKNLERVTDAFEDVANQIDGIVIDHA